MSNNPYEHEIEAIKALADAHCALLQHRDTSNYNIQKLLEAASALSETIVAKSKKEIGHD